MTVLKLETSRPPAFLDLQAGLIGYAEGVEQLRSPSEVLDELHAVMARHLPLAVLGAARFPLKSGDLGIHPARKTGFPAQKRPRKVVGRIPCARAGQIPLFLAASSMAVHTWTEARRLFQ